MTYNLFSRDENDDNNDDPEEFSSFFGGDRNDPFGESFFHFNDQIQRQMEAMEGLMQEMFKNFGATEFPSSKLTGVSELEIRYYLMKVLDFYWVIWLPLHVFLAFLQKRN